ncbi:hypothetical protein OAO42_01740 [Candidatus Izimaplasma bacterium]|nr:hypothetical protein [Candidatus Izimaplasma bacterium]
MASYKKIAQDLQWEFGNGYAYHNKDGFLVTLINSVNFISVPPLIKRLVVAYDKLEETQLTELQNYLQEDKKEYKLLQSEVKYTYVSIELNENKKTIDATRLQELLDHVINRLISLGITGSNKCVYCSQELPDSITKIYNVQFPSHKECSIHTTYGLDTLGIEYKDNEKNYIQGTLGALFGAFMGMVPYVALSMFLNKISAVLAFLICYLAFFFYKKVGGKLSKVTSVIIGLTTVLAVVLTNVIVAGIIIYINDGTLTMDNFKLIYTDPGLSTIMIADLALGLMVALFSFVTINTKIKLESSQEYISE